MGRKTTRREFLRNTAGAGVGFWVGSRALAESRSPNERLAVAVVGIEGQGAWNIGQLVEAGARIVALCDVDEPRTGKMRERFPNARFEVDYRRLLDRNDIDAVLIATPDHHHAPATLRALAAGKHVYCEKPLTHTVEEARAVAEAARKHKRVTQMGTQIHARSNYRRVVEVIRSGAIGPVGEVHVWVDRQWGGNERPKETPPVPEGLHYDLWLGPARERPYHPAYLPGSWRGWWDFGGGTLADMGCHYTDLPFWALDLRVPETIEAQGPPVHPESCPPWMIVRYRYAARGEQPAVKLTWYHGANKIPGRSDVPHPIPEELKSQIVRPPHFAEGKLPKWGDGVLFVGLKGMLLADYDRYLLLPREQYEGYEPPPPSIPESIGHHREWIEACKTGDKTTCNFDYAGALTEAVLLGNVAYRSGKRLEWDARALRARNAPEADRYLRHHYREGWAL